MDIAELEQLLALIRDANIRELTLRQGESRITIRKAPSAGAQATGRALIPVAVETATEADFVSVDELGFLPEEPSSVPITAQAQAEVYACGPVINAPSAGQYCLWYGATASGGPGIGIVGEAEVWYYDAATSTGPVMDCSDSSVGCVWSQNGAVAYCAQPINPNTGAPTGAPMDEPNAAGFNCNGAYTTNPPAKKWPTIPCNGTRIQCRNEAGSGPNLP